MLSGGNNLLCTTNIVSHDQQQLQLLPEMSAIVALEVTSDDAAQSRTFIHVVYLYPWKDMYFTAFV